MRLRFCMPKLPGDAHANGLKTKHGVASLAPHVALPEVKGCEQQPLLCLPKNVSFGLLHCSFPNFSNSPAAARKHNSHGDDVGFGRRNTSHLAPCNWQR